jgi:AcrR family transcriptional regulator
MPDASPKKRRRLSPHKRRAMILDHAAEVVVSEGIAGATMERIARKSDVSKSLIYAYFDNITELLRELNLRELRRLRHLQLEAAERSDTFEEMVRKVTHQYIGYIAESGLVLQQLQSEPHLNDGPDPTYYSRKNAVRYIAILASARFNMPMELALASSDISFGIPAAAGELFKTHPHDPVRVEDITVHMILGAFVGVSDAYKKGLIATSRPKEKPPELN